MAKLNYLNLGCGSKFHNDWINIDMVSHHPSVISYNLVKGIPYPDNQMDVIYHSQVLEHIPKGDAPGFIKECLRVLKPGGIMRIVVPDLENIATEYLNHLKKNIDNPTVNTEADYDWILLEMYDQTVRNNSGGLMAEYLKKPNIVNEEYILGRSGAIGKLIRNDSSEVIMPKTGIINILKRLVRKILNFSVSNIKSLTTSKRSRIGAFRLGGEVHMWMYDRFSLSRLLTECGFSEVKVKNPFNSDISNWGDYELDVKDGQIFDSVHALFIEAKKA